ncbi:initiator tRNA phosphoribosyl transferase, partial [Cystobasidium minutum MCA 4210]|uniref:initiator tRNA phosphoribosyl transferase n=1 Tax=Cystobasidium minutum MCA 4210 TaxID=1397322 RepID=UPI0034CE9387
YNRLHSIALDSSLVKAVSDVYPDFAVVPNLRCGAWYVEPDGPRTVNRNVYFKSMDGHAGQWSFPLRRPNFPFLDVIMEHGGAIIVDSTRRGKRFPDALSKTVPIWCAVINRAVHAKAGGSTTAWTEEDLDIHTANASVGESERDQIRCKLDGWAKDLLASSYALPELKKPLRPLHISPSSRLPDVPLPSAAFESFYPVICLSASRYTSGGSSERYGSFNYVPGSGDDHEGWVPPGFGPEHFWANRGKILASPREDLYGVMQSLC